MMPKLISKADWEEAESLFAHDIEQIWGSSTQRSLNQSRAIFSMAGTLSKLGEYIFHTWLPANFPASKWEFSMKERPELLGNGWYKFVCFSTTEQQVTKIIYAKENPNGGFSVRVGG